MKTAVFAGTFDPFTIGHYDIVSRGALLFDSVIIAVAGDSTSRAKADVDDRVAIARASTSDLKNVVVKFFDGMLVDFAKREKCSVILRGLRNASDFDYEKSLGQVYKLQDKSMECAYLISSAELSHISSTTVRQLLALNGDVDGYVCRCAIENIKRCYGSN